MQNSKLEPHSRDIADFDYKILGPIEYRSDDVTKNSSFFFFAFQRFGYHVSVEHDEKHPQPKFGGNRFMGARDMTA